MIFDMRIGRYGTLFGFAVQVIGAGVALAYPEAKGFGYALIMAGALVLVAASAAGVYSHERKSDRGRVEWGLRRSYC
jgi:hypothetical protein